MAYCGRPQVSDCWTAAFEAVETAGADEVADVDAAELKTAVEDAAENVANPALHETAVESASTAESAVEGSKPNYAHTTKPLGDAHPSPAGRPQDG